MTLADHLTEHFHEFGGDMTLRNARVLANLAISGIGTAYPDGWSIESGSGNDGIDDGITRLELVDVLLTYSRDRFRYRGAEFHLEETPDGGLLDTDFGGNRGFAMSYAVAGESLRRVLATIRDVDTMLDFIRADAA